VTPKRNDLVVWWNRPSESAFLTFELKTPSTIHAPALLDDADRKAKRWGAPYFAIWNMQAAELYRTPEAGTLATPQHRLRVWEPDSNVRAVEDWLTPRAAASLHVRALETLDAAWEAHTTAGRARVTIDGSVFVDRIALRLRQLRAEIEPALAARTASDRTLRRRLRSEAAAQGWLGFVENIDAAVTGQYAYRLIGQILFYHSLRRTQPSLPEISLSAGETIPGALRPYWDQARRFDYEALFELSFLDQVVPVPPSAQAVVRSLIGELRAWDWGDIRQDVLGAAFEQLIPHGEQHLLGQFYTQPAVADLLLAFAVSGDDATVLDPGCGSGTFLMRAYDLLRYQLRLDHSALLSRLWGFDISAFAAELAAINLFRKDMGAFGNFPRIVPRDFFERRVGEPQFFLPARAGGPPVTIEVPAFAAVVGNPPYLRSQNQDDLDPSYKARLFQSARGNGIQAAKKTDLFAFFVYQSLAFMRPGSRLAFITSSSWLTSDFGIPLKALLLDRLRLVALVSSSVESFLSQVDINTVLLIAEMREVPGVQPGEMLRFVTLKKPLSELFDSDDADRYWASLVAFADAVEGATESREDGTMRLKVVPAAGQLVDASGGTARRRNWSVYLRAPLSYYSLFGEV